MQFNFVLGHVLIVLGVFNMVAGAVTGSGFTLVNGVGVAVVGVFFMLVSVYSALLQTAKDNAEQREKIIVLLEQQLKNGTEGPADKAKTD